MARRREGDRTPSWEVALTLTALFHGFLLALALILPIGPQNTFVLTRGSQSGRFRQTLPVVLTAALSDTLLIAIAVGGVGLLLLSLPWLSTALSAVGILYIVYIGLRFWKSAGAATQPSGTTPHDLRSDITRSLSVSLLNPHAILDTIGIIGAASAQYLLFGQRIAFALGAVIVSWIWFFALALFGQALGLADQNRRMRLYLQRISALLMWAIALRMALSLLIT